MPSAGVRVPVPHGSVGAYGQIADAASRKILIETFATIVAELATMR